MYKFSKRSLRHLRGVEPLLIAIMCDSIKDSPHDFGIPKSGGKRSAEEQNLLYQQGRTLPGDIVTNCDGFTKLSNHQLGVSVDFFAYVGGKRTYSVTYMTDIARHIQAIARDRYKVNLIWGGDWRWKDLPHIQMRLSEV